MYLIKPQRAKPTHSGDGRSLEDDADETTRVCDDEGSAQLHTEHTTRNIITPTYPGAENDLKNVWEGGELQKSCSESC